MSVVEKLAIQMEKNNLTINNMVGETINTWTFGYEYPGFYAFNREDFTVCCTPNLTKRGIIEVQPHDENGEVISEMCEDVPYEGKLTEKSFVRAMMPVLARVDGYLHKAVRS